MLRLVFEFCQEENELILLMERRLGAAQTLLRIEQSKSVELGKESKRRTSGFLAMSFVLGWHSKYTSRNKLQSWILGREERCRA